MFGLPLGNARDQLLATLHKKRIVPEEDLRKAVELAECNFAFSKRNEA